MAYCPPHLRPKPKPRNQRKGIAARVMEGDAPCRSRAEAERVSRAIHRMHREAAR